MMKALKTKKTEKDDKKITKQKMEVFKKNYIKRWKQRKH